MSSASQSRSQRTTVLVLEDDEGLADLYATWLSAEYNVRTAYTAAEAREKFDEDVDIALIDRRLPDESGDEVLDWIARAHPQCRRAMVTAVNPDVDVVEMPFDEYLIKPIDKDDLMETVRRLDTQRNDDEIVRDLHALTEKRAHLRSELNEAQRSDGEAYARLESEISDLVDDAAEANVALDEMDVRGIARRLEDDTEGDQQDG